jgi:O-methyltransferase involved in polyketide biosynthesis
MLNSAPDPSKISPTAKLVAYWRQFSDVPYAKEVSDLIGAKELSEKILKSPTSLENMAWLAPMIEARYKSINSAIQSSGIKQIFELASGVALRGLALTSDPEVVYVETDLKGISEEKKTLVEKIRALHALEPRTNLYFETVNVLSLQELDEASRHFNPGKPIAIIHEGLMPYLSIPEKETLAKNIHTLLEKFGGVWITPDFTHKKELEKSWNRNGEMEKMIQAVGSLTERNFKDAAFENEEAIQGFCERMGFEFSVSPQIDGSYKLTSTESVSVSKNVIEDCKRDLSLWTLRVKS